jgi:enterochelin esterase family protein
MRCFSALALVLGLGIGLASGVDVYPICPEAKPVDGVPKGKITEYKFENSEVFKGTSRTYWVYVPAQYDGTTPAAVMVFQDGVWYRDPNGQWRVPTVFDNLIHEKAMPVTVGIFVNPGEFPDRKGRDGKPQSNRSFEYDTPNGEYAKFIETELLPEVSKTVKLRTDAKGRAICGISSGGICAFTAAWERPDLFSKVLSHIGSFANIRGGHAYHGQIRKTKVKPIRLFLQDGDGDLDNEHGSWPLGNQTLVNSLKYMGYDYKFVYGDGAHNGKHGAAILGDSLRWLWRGWEDELPK